MHVPKKFKPHSHLIIIRPHKQKIRALVLLIRSIFTCCRPTLEENELKVEKINITSRRVQASLKDLIFYKYALDQSFYTSLQRLLTWCRNMTHKKTNTRVLQAEAGQTTRIDDKSSIYSNKFVKNSFKIQFQKIIRFSQTNIQL